jgi:hypothetical protein
MQTLQRDPGQAAGYEAGALIQEARRRQRRRHLAAALTAVVVLTAAVAAVAGRHASGHHRQAAPARAGRRPAPPRPLLAGVSAQVVMWPSGGPESWMSGAYVDDLGTGHVALRDLPGIYGCDCDPYVISTGARVVYVAWSGIASLPAGLAGKQRWLGPGGSFAPSATPGYIWRYAKGKPWHGRVSVYQIPAAGGRPGAAITLPQGASLIMGTDGGLLLNPPNGRHLALWNLGASPRTLPHSAGYQWAGADARLVAYGTGCRWRETARRASLVGRAGYDICRTLRVFDVVTGQLMSFSAPAGTAGWRPNYLFDDANPISPAGTMIAAYAKLGGVVRDKKPGRGGEVKKLPPQQQGRVRLYVLRLTGPRHRVRAVPYSAQGLLGATMAWTPDGSWLLYQGPGGHLWAYQPGNGKVRTSRTPCCQYIGMLAFPTRPATGSVSRRGGRMVLWHRTQVVTVSTKISRPGGR